jgi:Uma2 family endonuclease
MSQPTPISPHDIFYPESDGEPMGETDFHVEELLALLGLLKHRDLGSADVYVAGNNFIYYEQGNPKKVFSPDVYVVKGVENRRRRTYKLWEENVAPCFVMEVSSKSTLLEDMGNKKALCAMLGVGEYFLFDPELDVLDPALQGFRLVGQDYQRIAARPNGSVQSDVLGLVLSIGDARRLHCTDTSSGERLLRPEEEYRARQAAETRADAAEQELARLREQLKQPR